MRNVFITGNLLAILTFPKKNKCSRLIKTFLLRKKILIFVYYLIFRPI